MEIDWCCTKKGTAAVDCDLELLEWVKQYLLRGRISSAMAVPRMLMI
jgi:hypothetical protein